MSLFNRVLSTVILVLLMGGASVSCERNNAFAEAAPVPVETAAPTGATEMAQAETEPVETEPVETKPTEAIEPEETTQTETELTETEPAPRDDSETEIRVLVSINQQHLWCYQGEEVLFDCDVVTGLANQRDTPVGEYAIYAKTAGCYLKGPGYKSWVDYWMPFYRGYGLHDADWRAEGEFGGDTYLTDGSHGCVNMPDEFAAQLFGLVKVGTKIVIEE